MLNRLGAALALRMRRWIPDPFVFALGLTVLVGATAWIATDAGPLVVVQSWYRGFWMLLEFGMQMVLILTTGYAIALSSAVSRLIDAVARRVHRPASVYFVVMVLGGLFSLVSWGWVVLVAIIARELAERVRGIDYAYLVACVYVSSQPWVSGLSSSIPLLLNTEGNFLIENDVLESTIGTGSTLGSALNLSYLAFHFVVLPILMVWMRPRSDWAVALDELATAASREQPSVAEEAAAEGSAEPSISDRLNTSILLQLVVVAAGLWYIGWHFVERGFDLNLNIMIFTFLVLGLVAHRTPIRYVVAVKRACGNVSGIIFQYPFYAGIMGIMTFTGLAELVSDVMAARATVATLPAIAQASGALLNLAIPSAGGEWAVIGPAFVESAKTLATALPSNQLEPFIGRIAMAVAFGETSTNLLQPFYLLTILPVMAAGVRVRARDVMGYLVIPFVVIYLATAALVTWVPL